MSFKDDKNQSSPNEDTKVIVPEKKDDEADIMDYLWRESTKVLKGYVDSLEDRCFS